ncbi:MAG TPA: ethanolamine ammonia-lyase subunit EutB [Oligoflexus sp.]|uniref:ethanolamine ammonia-lyase subunit EutB n=1 Tax=Oligoflexus sp. TaxID=1971216 RepID=UPI002D26BC64|nr:ethanolamine ammonia-lyase subunit EutB [Oligoflexus sp.]HYX32807.1 ethanolamine ammonia-lyase subunit EutB [Oligoflexus sp.]
MTFRGRVGQSEFYFADLKTLLAKASPLRSADQLAGVAAVTATERVAAQRCLADVPLGYFLQELVIPYESDAVSRLIVDSHDQKTFSPLASKTVGEFRDWLLDDQTQAADVQHVKDAITPEMAAAVSKLMRNQDLVLAARKCPVITRFRSTVGLPGRLSTRLQPNHPTDDPRGIAVSLLDGLLLGSGDAVIGINPATDIPDRVVSLLQLLADVQETNQIPTQNCVLAHATTQIQAIERGAPLDLLFQSIAGSEKANEGFGVTLDLLKEAQAAALSLKRNPHTQQVMYFETGQGSALSADAAFGVDAQTMEARAYAVARAFDPFLVNTVVGFIGPEYLADGKQIIRAGLEDHFCGKLLGLPMGCDVCYTMHALADQDDMDALLTLLGAAGCNYIMGVPGADDIMLNYQSSSFHDALYLREALGLRPSPEFEAWLATQGLLDVQKNRLLHNPQHRLLSLPTGSGI